MTLFENSAAFVGRDDVLIDIKIIQSKGLRQRISETTNTQTAIVAEDTVANELEQLRIRELLRMHAPPYYYASKRGAWERETAVEKKRYLAPDATAGRHRRLTSKELAAVCLASFGEPEAAKDKPRLVFERPAGKRSPYYERIFMVANAASQWILPYELMRQATTTSKALADGGAEGTDARLRVSEYGRYRMVHLAYRWLKARVREEGDFLSAKRSEEYASAVVDWGPPVMELILDALVDAFEDAQRSGDSSGLREFFREKRHQKLIFERFETAMERMRRTVEKVGQTLDGYLKLPPV